MFIDSLPNAGRTFFKKVRLISNKREIENCDVIVNLNTWNFEQETGYNFKGLPMVFAIGGDAFVSLSAEVEVSGPEIGIFRVKESAKGNLHSEGMLFPVARLRRTMTEASDLATIAVSEKIMENIANDSRVRAVANTKPIATEPVETMDSH